MKAKLASHHRNEVSVLDRTREVVHSVERVGDRLLDEEMTSRLGEALRDGQMETRRIADERDVRASSDRLVQIRELADGESIGHRVLLIGNPAVGDHMRQPPGTVRDQLDVRAEQRPKIARMPLADRAEADEQCTQRRITMRRGHSGSAGTIMFARNSSRSRKGQRSSSGLDTMDPSGRRMEERLGARGSSTGVITSQTIGPAKSSTRSTRAARSCWFSMREYVRP